MPFIIILTQLNFFLKSNNYFEASLSQCSRYYHSVHFGIFGFFLLPLVKNYSEIQSGHCSCTKSFHKKFSLTAAW